MVREREKRQDTEEMKRRCNCLDGEGGEKSVDAQREMDYDVTALQRYRMHTDHMLSQKKKLLLFEHQ